MATNFPLLIGSREWKYSLVGCWANRANYHVVSLTANMVNLKETDLQTWPRRASDFVGENRSSCHIFLPGQEVGNCWFSQDPVESWGVLTWLPGQASNFYRDIWIDLQPPFFQDLWSNDIPWWLLIWRCAGGGTGAERDYLDAFTRGQLKVFKALNGGSKIVDRSRYSYFSSGGLLWMRWLASCSWICL